jgi:peroxiredoxin
LAEAPTDIQGDEPLQGLPPEQRAKILISFEYSGIRIKVAEKNYLSLPADLPVPVDDGACDHLKAGTTLPGVKLSSTRGGSVDVQEASSGKAVFFFYPMTGKPGVSLPEGWNDIPGARGCTPESCSYRDLYKEFKVLGYEIFGISTQSAEDQKEFSDRVGIPYAILSDSRLELTHALNLPTFSVKEIASPLIKRLTIVASKGKIDRVFYPVFPPDKNADEVVQYLRHQQY